MAIRAAQIGTGNVGAHALTALITNPGLRAHRRLRVLDAKAGKDAAELVGHSEPTGSSPPPTRTRCCHHRTAVWLHNAMADNNRLMEALEDYRRILAAGVNIVGSGPVFLQWPRRSSPTR